MEANALLVAGSLLGLVGVGTLRLAWARETRSLALNIVGWLLLVVAAIDGGVAAGAWGVAVVSLCPMGGALLLLALAALRSEPGRQRASNRRAGLLPQDDEPMRVAGRLLTFLLVVVIAAMLSAGLGVTVGALALLAGWSKANAYAVALFLTPFIWALLAYGIMMQPARRGQFKLLGIASVPVWPTLVMGMLS